MSWLLDHSEEDTRHNPQICDSWSTPWITWSPLLRNHSHSGTVYNKQPLQYKVDDHPQENNGNLDVRLQHLWFFCLPFLWHLLNLQKPSPCLRHDGIRSLPLLDRRTANSQKSLGCFNAKNPEGISVKGSWTWMPKCSSNHTQTGPFWVRRKRDCLQLK